MKTFNSIREETLEEKLKASDPTGKYISDFVHSDNPKFAGKSKKERIRMALGASYGAKKTNEAKDSREYDYIHSEINEEDELDETAWGKDKMTNLRQAHDRHMEKAIAANKTGDNEAVKTHQRKMQMIKTQMQKHKQNEEVEIDEAAQGHTIEAQGIRGMKATPWRKTFKSYDHLSKWADANDSVEVHGTRDLEQAKKGNLSPAIKEAKDPREYDYEGDMAKSQLRSIIANAQTVHDMLEDDTNMAEWVQSKITLSADYISTVRDYMQANKEE